MALAKLLGEKLIKMEGDEEVEVDVSSLEGEGKVIGIYFSAHWCPPCRAFTPQLAKWYKRMRDGIVGDKFSIIFASSDRDEESFKDYFKTMPWLAIPYSDRDRKSDLSKKYKVSGIPTLVLVDAFNGKLITPDGRSVAMEDDNGRDFPWKPKPFLEVISEGKFKNQRGKEVGSEAIKGKTLGVYFSAHWCGPCRSFTPTLSALYKKLKEDKKEFEIVFVSSDKDENEYKKYFDTMPWIGIPYGDKRKKILSRMFNVQGIPTLVIVDENGEIINENGRAAITDNPDGSEYPWYPKPVRPLTDSSASDINDLAALIWVDKSVKMDDMLKEMEPVAKPKIEEAKAAGVDPMAFFAVNIDDYPEGKEIWQSLRKFASFEDKTPLLVIVDINDEQVFISDADEVNRDVIAQFVDGFFKKTLTGRSLRK